MAKVNHLCRQCTENFSSLTNFDKHQTQLDDDRGTVECATPQELGFEFKDGKWWDPAASRALRAAFGKDDRAFGAQSDRKTLTCKDCGVNWEVERSRGRYPSRCNQCKE